MDPSSLHLFLAKTACLALMAGVTACGARVDQQDDAAVTTAPARNQLTLITDGAYGVDLTTADVTCRRRVDGQELDLRFRQATGRDAGLQVNLTVAGPLAHGDVLAAGDGGDRFFDLRLTTPAGAVYHFSSTSPAAAAGTLTVIQSSPFMEAGRLQLTSVTSGAEVLDVHGSFSCSRWL